MLHSKEREIRIDNVLYQNKKKVWYMGGRIPVYAMQDHDGAGNVWDYAYMSGIISSGSTLVHVDAHDDLILPANLPSSLEELRKHTYQIGSFIAPRVNIGMINNIVWLLPRVRDGLETYLEIVKKENERLSNKPKVEVTDVIPKMHVDLLDIDLDYFTEEVSELLPDFVLKWRAVRFLTELTQKISGVKIITVATSPGFTQMNRERPLLEAALEVFLE